MYSTEIWKLEMRRLYIILACLIFCIISYADVSPSSQKRAISDIKDGKLWHKSFFSVELPEFQRSVLEVLRQPLEDRIINISRAKYSTTFPCSFMFVASMNPCPLNCFSIMEGTEEMYHKTNVCRWWYATARCGSTNPKFRTFLGPRYKMSLIIS